MCLGNICRSPTAEGVFRKLVTEHDLGHGVIADSAGTHAYHIDEPPDMRAQHAAAKRGIDLSSIRGRKATTEDIRDFDYILAMDWENYHNLLHMAGDLSDRENIRLLLQYSEKFDEEEVPDPYYGGAKGFERVLDMIEDASLGLLADIKRRYSL
ncbi:MAG: low molecular weight protein-tyrosine-phosphatase [Arenicellales bacterium]|nr:low molecular weight protein-tyrosine-phosphatase [Arenicellales bacterium]